MSNGGDDTSTRMTPWSRWRPRERWVTATQVAGLASIGAGAVHAAAIGIHAEHATLSRLFVLAAVAQIAVGLLALIKGGRANLRWRSSSTAVAVVVWAVTRTAGISWIEGLEQAEDPQFADTACALLGALAAGAALVALARHRTTGVRSPARPAIGGDRRLRRLRHAGRRRPCPQPRVGGGRGGRRPPPRGATEAAAPAADAAAAADGHDPTTDAAVDAEAASPAGEGAAEAHAHDTTRHPPRPRRGGDRDRDRARRRSRRPGPGPSTRPSRSTSPAWPA